MSPFNCFLLTIDYVPSIFETSQSKLMKKLFPVSLLSLEKFCLLAIVSSTIIPLFVMVIVWLKYYSIAISRNLVKLMDATAVSGTHANQINVLFAESLVIVPQPVHSLVAAGAVISPAIWPGSVRRLGTLCFLFLVLGNVIYPRAKSYES